MGNIDGSVLKRALLQSVRGKGSLGVQQNMDVVRPKITGNLKIEAIYADGKKDTLVDDKNLVVSLAETILPFMAIGLRSFSYVELGDPAPSVPPVLADTNLQQTTGERKPVTPTTSGNTVTLEALWAAADGNGYSFTEAGLFTLPFGTGLLFARKTFPAITKTAAFALKFSWTIAFTISGEGGSTGISLIGSSTLTSDYLYPAVGGEAQIIVPIDFNVGTKQLDVFLNGQRLAYGAQYFETMIGALKGIGFVGYTLLAGDNVYIVHRKIS